MAEKLYKLRDSYTEKERIGTLEELSAWSDISTEMLKDMAKGGDCYKSYYCKACTSNEQRLKKPSTNQELDRIAIEARAHGMSYGQYVGLMEYNWRNCHVKNRKKI